MNAREIHSLTENINEIGWFRVKFPDKGAGSTHIHAYVQGDSEEMVREMARRHDHFSAYNADKGKVNRSDIQKWNELRTAIIRAGGPNSAIGQDGDVIRRSDVRGDDNE